MKREAEPGERLRRSVVSDWTWMGWKDRGGHCTRWSCAAGGRGTNEEDTIQARPTVPSRGSACAKYGAYGARTSQRGRIDVVGTTEKGVARR
jgi:hypothetical protein